MVVLDGYKEIKKVIEKSSNLLKGNGKLIVEIGDTQKELHNKIVKKKWICISTKLCKDLSGKDRCIICTKFK